MVFTHVQILWESVLFPYQICALPPLYGFSVSTQDEPRHSSYWHSIFCVSEFCCARCQIHCLLQLNSLKFWVLLCKNPLHREQKKAWKMFFSHSDTGVSWEVGSASVRWLAWSCADRCSKWSGWENTVFLVNSTKFRPKWYLFPWAVCHLQCQHGSRAFEPKQW